MFSQISWSEYILSIVIIVAIYYVYVFFKYYAGDVQQRYKQRNELVPRAAYPQSGQQPTELIDQLEVEAKEAVEDDFDQIESLIDELKSQIELESQAVIVNKELWAELKNIVDKYPALKDTPYSSAINDLILSECARHGLDTLDEDDVARLWA